MTNALPMAQSSSDAGIGLQCFIYLLLFGGAILILLHLKSETQNATPLSRTIQTGFAPPVVMQMALESFRGYKATSNPHELLLSGTYLSTGQILLLLLLTGIIPGALLYYLLMGRTEELAMDTSEWLNGGNVTLNARGIRAIERAQKLIGKLEAQPFTETQAQLAESSLEPVDLPPLGPETADFLNNLKSDSAKRRWVTIQSLSKQPIHDPRIAAELQRLMFTDPKDYVREEATKALGLPAYRDIARRK